MAPRQVHLPALLSGLSEPNARELICILRYLPTLPRIYPVPGQLHCSGKATSITEYQYGGNYLTFRRRLLPSIAQLKACTRDDIARLTLGYPATGQSLGAVGQCPTPGSASGFKPSTGEEVATRTTSRCNSPPCAANSLSPVYQSITIYLKSSPISSLFSFPSLVTVRPPALRLRFLDGTAET